MLNHMIHVRVSEEEFQSLEELKRNGETLSELIKKGIGLLKKERERHKKNKAKNALELAGNLVGAVDSKLKDLSTNKKHLEGFGE